MITTQVKSHLEFKSPPLKGRDKVTNENQTAAKEKEETKLNSVRLQCPDRQCQQIMSSEKGTGQWQRQQHGRGEGDG
eukprot:4243340-Amphidinium_carterae.1